MTIFRDFRALVVAIRELVSVLEQAVRAQREIGPAIDRIESLELSRHHFEAEIQGVLLQSDGKLKAARNAEARERQLKKSYENNLLDPIDEEGGEVPKDQTVLPLHAQDGQAEGVHPMRLDVAANNKAVAVMTKWASLR